ncbi:hypothetical protein BH10PSE7_BH10PSE7_01810 [soil metagenome]
MSVRRLDPVQPEHFAFTPANLIWAKETIAKYPPGKQASAVIPLLWRAQEQNAGWVSKAAMEYVAAMLDMSFIRLYEVATFYSMFQLSPVGRKAHIQVCGTTPCMLRGAEALRSVCERKIHHEPHHRSANGDFSWEEVECLGACVNAPMVQIWDDTFEDLTPESFEKLIDDLAAGKPVKPGPQNGRQFSAPAGGPLTLTDPALFGQNGKPRTFTHMDPPPPAAPPPSNAGKPGSAAIETAPGVKSPLPVKTGEADAALAKKQDQAAASATPEKAPSKVAASKDSPASPKKPADA